MTAAILTLTDLDLANPAEPRISDVKLAEVLGYERPANIRKLIKRHQSSLEQFGSVLSMVEQTSAEGGRPGHSYSLNRKQALFVCTKSDTPMATAVTIALVEVFDAVLTHRQLPVPALPARLTYRDAWRIRQAKLRLAEAVGALDAMGVDVTAIDVKVVRDFWRQIAA